MSATPAGEPRAGIPAGGPLTGAASDSTPAGAPKGSMDDPRRAAGPGLRVASPVPPAAPIMDRAPRRRRVIRAAVLLVVPVGLLLGFAAFVRAAIDPAAPVGGETDGIVVLTGGSERVATGFRLLAENQARRLLISGAHPEASLAGIAAAAGIDPAPFAGRVAVGHAAASTRGNAAETAAWARAEEMRSLRIVTAGYHMPRAMVELRRAMPGLALVEHPVPSAALRGPGALWRPQIWALLAGEYARYLGAWAGLSGAFVPRRETQAT